jgi:hypothetical protein
LAKVQMIENPETVVIYFEKLMIYRFIFFTVKNFHDYQIFTDSDFLASNEKDLSKLEAINEKEHYLMNFLALI